jgi:hypothetical protein
MEDIRQVLEYIISMQRTQIGIDPFPATTKVEARTASSEKYTIQTIAQVSPNFQVTPNML